jgi:uncharacterized alkaline shock family protein YloU
MSNIKLGTENVQGGKVVYDASIIQSIVALAVREVDGALPVKGKNEGVSLRIEREAIYADVSVVAKYGFDVPELAYRIQQSVIHSVENMTNYKVAKVDVHVVDVVFVEQVAVEEPAEDEAETEEN